METIYIARNLILGFAVALWITKARDLNHQTVKCSECRGCGHEDPDCEACSGYGSITLEKAEALGWSRDDLEDVDESDGYCECPDCGGDTCELCSGDGTVPAYEAAQEERRALIFARYQRLPPVCTVDHWGRRHREVRCLSWEAARPHHESGAAMRLNSVLGHEFYLRNKADFPSLWRAARERAKAAR